MTQRKRADNVITIVVNDPANEKITLTQLPRHQFLVGQVIQTADWVLEVVKVTGATMKVRLHKTLRPQDVEQLNKDMSDNAPKIIKPNGEIKLCR